MSTLAPPFLTGSPSFLQVTRKTIKSWMYLNFCQIQLPTIELAALAFLKNQCIKTPFLLDRLHSYRLQELLSNIGRMTILAPSFLIDLLILIQ